MPQSLNSSSKTRPRVEGSGSLFRQVSLCSGGTGIHECVRLVVRESLEQDPSAVSLEGDHEFPEGSLAGRDPWFPSHCADDGSGKRLSSGGVRAFNKVAPNVRGLED